MTGVGDAIPLVLDVAVGRSDAAARSSAGAGGVFSGFDVSSSFRADLDFSAFFVLCETCLDFFDFGLGVGVWCRLDFREALALGVSRGVGFGVASSSSSDFGFALRGREDSCAPALSSRVDSSFADFAFAIGVGDFFSFEEECVFFCDSSCASFAWGIVVGAFSAVARAGCFFPDLSLDPFAAGLGDFFGFGDDVECLSVCSDLSRRLFSSSPVWARRRVPTITPETSAVVSQMQKRTTATERNRARDAINQIVKKVKRVTRLKRQSRLPFYHLTFNSRPQSREPQGQPRAFFRLPAEELRLTYRPVIGTDMSDTST